jgi:hypothetical protein
MPSTYTAFGLTFASELPLPGLLEAPAPPTPGAPPDVTLHAGPVRRLPAHGSRGELRWTARAEEARVYTPAGAFLAVGGAALHVDADPLASPDLLRHHVLGVAVPVLLQQRGLLVLHGSAAACDGRATAVVGVSGSGKSTTVAALHRGGWPVVCDDVTAVDLAGPVPRVRPYAPRVRLLPDAARGLGHAGAPPGHDGKREPRLDRGFAAAPVPLVRVVMPHDGPARALVRLAPQAAFAALVRHSYLPFDLLRAMGRASEHLAQCARLAASVPVCRLVRPRDLAALPALVAFLAPSPAAAGAAVTPCA